MADHEMCVPVSIGETALIPACIECCARQMCVRQRIRTATTCGIFVAGTWFLAITMPGIANLNPTEVERMLGGGGIVETVMEAYIQAERVRPCDGTWGQSPFSFMGIQLSGSPTWHPVSGFLEVIWGLPEFVSMWHGLYRWWHVDTGSSGGRTTSSGSRTSSPSSIAYTICKQPLLRRF